MGIIRFAIENPVKVTVAVLLVALFGLIALFRVPIQLTPNVDEPRVTVTTRWEGANPEEVERRIVEPQEEQLKGVRGLRKMTSESRQGVGRVVLDFYVGQDMDVALRDVDDKLGQVRDLPEKADKPTRVASTAAESNAIAWMILRGDPGVDITKEGKWVEDNVKPILERVEGISEIRVYGGREREVQVRVDAAALAARQLTLADVARALQRQNVNVAAGTVERGKQDLVVRTRGQYEQADDVRRTVITIGEGGPIYVEDVASVEVEAFKKQRSFVRSKGEVVLALPAFREVGANVIGTMERLTKAIEKVNAEILGPRGMGLELTKVYDETGYIHSAIDLVQWNLIVGGTLAIIVLLVFLRSGRATFVVAASIPVSVIGAFLVMALLGRTLNVVSLAGMAFAVGMVVDNAIVVLENIYRHRQMGKSRFDAAFDGAREVWGAVLASTLTTIAVFLPVIFVEEEAGQLFRDIAIAISAGVGLSLCVAMTVIPTLSSKVLRGAPRETAPHVLPLAAGTGPVSHRPRRLRQALRRSASTTAHGLARPIVRFGAAFTNAVSEAVYWINGRVWARLAVVTTLTIAALVGSARLMAPTSYLPNGNRNLVIGYVITPPGYSIEAFRMIGDAIDRTLRPLWDAKPGTPAAEQLPKVPMMLASGSTNPGSARIVQVRPPPIENHFYVAFFGRSFMGVTSQEELCVAPLISVCNQAAGQIPDVMPYFSQASLFGHGLAGGNTVDVEIRGEKLSEVRQVAGLLRQEITTRYGFVRPEPINFWRGRPELRPEPDLVRAKDLGLTTEDIGFVVETCVDGALLGDFREQGEKFDLTLVVQGAEERKTEEIAQLPIYTPSGHIVPLDSIAPLESTEAADQINHIEEMPAVALIVQAPQDVALETLMNTIGNDVIAPMRQSGRIPSTVLTSLAGTADKLRSTFDALKWGFLLALIITYLLMAALFESFAYPFVIMFSVPLATVGGFAGLAIVHWASLLDPVTPVQQLDVLTMLGFVILVGVVVNNAILIVHQALNNMRDGGMQPREAIRESVRTRIRPIFMSAMTSIFAMLPLVIRPGAGSELYRGLGSVVVGGLLVATVFTLLLVPSLFSLAIGAKLALARLIRG